MNNDIQARETDRLPVAWKRSEPGKIGESEANKALVKQIGGLIKAGERETLLRMLRGWNPIDVVELLVSLPLKRARELFRWLPTIPAAKVVAELNPELRVALMEASTMSRLTEVIDSLDPEEAADALDELPADLVEQILPQLRSGDEIRDHRRYKVDSAGSIMTTKFVAVPADWTVGQVIADIRQHAEVIEKLYAVYVVDSERRLQGIVKVTRLLLLQKEDRMGDFVDPEVIAVHADMDQEEVARIAEQYDLVTIPVVDPERRILGGITVEELQEVIRAEAEEDVKLMGGVSPGARPNEPVRRIVKGRLPWLLAGLLGSSAAAIVVGSFEKHLEEAAILAAFIPVVMAMAGNAGIQAATVAVQGLASGTLWVGDIGWRLSKELLGALINGLVAGVLLGLLVVVAARFIEIEAPVRLALATGLSLTSVTTMAAVIGSSVPLFLQHFKIDPAMATGVFITTSNDVLGVLVFFGIVTKIYLI